MTGWLIPLVKALSRTPRDRRSMATAEEAGGAFALSKPRLAVVYHHVSEDGMEAAVRQRYGGPLVLGRDRLCISVANQVTWRRR